MVGWTSYNYLSAISSSGETINFSYGPNRQRWKTQYTGSIGTETTYHVGKLLEKVANGGTIDYRHYIYAGRELLGIYSRTSAGTNTMRYVLSDHQQSFVTIDTGTNPGTDYVDESFDAFGNRRNGSTWSGAPPPSQESAINTASRRGYTGETVLGVSMGLNHLNGRVEDSIAGRFLSPDTVISNPNSTQAYNRYTYVNNNPLTVMDPTGHVGCVQTSGRTKEAAPDCGGAASDADDPPETVIITPPSSSQSPIAQPPQSVNLPAGSPVTLPPTSPDPGTAQSNPDPGAVQSTLGPESLPLVGAAGGGGIVGEIIGAIADFLGIGSSGNTPTPGDTADLGDTPASTPVGRSGEPMDVAPGTNSPGSVGDTDFSGHAFDQMQGRGIPPSAVQNTVDTGLSAPGNVFGTTTYYDPVNNITVVTNSFTGNVITVRPGMP